MTDNQVLDTVRESFADVRMHRPLETVLARGRGHRRQRRATAGGMLALVAGLAAVTAIGLDRAEPAVRSDAIPTQAAAAWSVATDDGGTITVKLHDINDLADPAALQRALAAARAPAIVRTGACTWPSPGRDYHGEGFSMGGPGGRQIIRITPSKLPKGALVVFAIGGQAAPPGTTEREGRGVIIRAGVMAAGGTVTCKP